MTTPASAPSPPPMSDDTLPISFSDALPDLGELDDVRFLQALRLRKKAPAELSAPARDGNVLRFCRELQTSGFGRPYKKLARRLGDTWQFAFSENAFHQTDRSRSLVEAVRNTGRVKKRRKMGSGRKKSLPKVEDGRLVAGGSRTTLGQWLDSFDRSNPLSPFELLVLLELLTRCGSELRLEDCWQAWRTALTGALRLAENDGGEDEDEPETTPDQRLVCDGELPFTAGVVFGFLKGAGKLADRGRRKLCRELCEQTDTDGTPNAALSKRLPFWLASLVRAAGMARQFDEELWDDDAGDRFHELVATLVPFCRSDGRLAFSNGHAGNVLQLLSGAAAVAGIKKKSPPGRYLAGFDDATNNGKGKGKGKKHTPKRRLMPAHDPPVKQSDWARMACLCSGWSAEADTLLVAHDGPLPVLDLALGGRTVSSGPWGLDLRLDGKPVEFTDGWTCVCWHSDDDADYLELRWTSGDLQVDRQLLLARDDYLLLADVVSGAEGKRIDYESRLPLVDGVTGEADTTTREMTLRGPKSSWRAFPLALPQERVVGTPGRFQVEDGAVVLSQAARGGLYAPVLFDWSRERRKRMADWRTLTVTESGDVVNSETAAGHRLRIGPHQLLVYRSVVKPTLPRAVLGHHTNHETVVGLFDADGTVDPVLEVE